MVFNKRTVMTNGKQWESLGKKNACRFCGQYIQNKEEYYLVYHPNDLNFLVHADEWETFKEGLTEEEGFEKLKDFKKPRPKNQSKLSEEDIEAFKRVLSGKRYRIKKETANRIYFKTSKDVAQFYFDKRFGTLEFTGRANGLFDGLFLREIYARLEEDWKKEMGKKVEKGFRVEKAVSEAVCKVNELLR
jgi:hypothetical protein